MLSVMPMRVMPGDPAGDQFDRLGLAEGGFVRFAAVAGPVAGRAGMQDPAVVPRGGIAGVPFAVACHLPSSAAAKVPK